MKRAFNLILIAVFSFVNAFSFIGCREIEAQPIDEVRACWVSSVGNLDFPSKMGLTPEELKMEIDAIIENCRNLGLNTIFFQVRPMGDALYRSALFPWSVYLTGTQGKAPEQGFDPLTYFVEKAHRAGLKLHAWINPYRIGAGEEVWDKLAKNNPAILHPEYTVTAADGVYYNPGHPQARSLILNGVAELVKNYEIDGIHFDDYFYPYNMEGFDDAVVYEQYGNGSTLENFRRESVNKLVEATFDLVKTYRKNAEFGISPFGIWANKSVNAAGSDTRGMSSYSAIYSDSKKWVEQGWVDYICPQIYWSFENEVAPYDVLVDWWDDLCKKCNVKLYVGIALYKVGTEEDGWESGSVIGRQLEYAAAKGSYAGHSFFRYGLLSQNVLSSLEAIRSYYNGSVSIETEQAVIEPIELQSTNTFAVTSPQSGTVVEGSAVSVTGVAPPGETVMVNGIDATVNSKGHFSAYVPLDVGANKIKAVAGNQSKTINVTRKQNKVSNLSVLDISSVYPLGDVHRSSGDLIGFEVYGPSSASVVLTNGSVSIKLFEDTKKPGFYSNNWTVPSFPSADKLILDGFYFETTIDGVTAKEKVDITLNLYPLGYRDSYCLLQDAYIFDESRGGSQMDHDPLPKGAAVTAVAQEGNRVRLDSGYWVERSVLTAESVEKKDVANYDYAIVTLATENVINYSVFSSESGLQLNLSLGLLDQLQQNTDTSDLSIYLERSASESVVNITSRSGKRIAGYEIFPQRNCLTVYLRFHTSGLAGKKIMLDAGHGGEDAGALSPGGNLYPAESALNLSLMATLKNELESAGAEVLITRGSNDNVTLEERVKKSFIEAPDLFVSLHHNSTMQTADYNKASGGMVLYSAPLSESLADSIAELLWNGVGKTAQSKRQSLYVCRQTRCPAVLIEAGFICNPMEYELLCRQDIMQKIAKNIVNGIENYFVTVCS